MDRNRLALIGRILGERLDGEQVVGTAALRAHHSAPVEERLERLLARRFSHGLD